MRHFVLPERFLYLGLRCARQDLEGVAALRVEQVGALGDDRPDHDLRGGPGRHSASSLWRGLKFSSRSSSVSFESSRQAWVKRSRMCRFLASTILAPARFSTQRLPVYFVARGTTTPSV